MAKNTDKFTVKKTVTIQSLKILDKHGLTYRADRNDATMTQALYDVCMNENSLREVCGAIFDDDFSNITLDEKSFDLREVIGGYKSFLQQFLSVMKS